MKKVLLFVVVIVGLGFTSCSKTECECTINGTTTVYDEDDAEELGFEGDFKEACEDSEPCKVK